MANIDEETISSLATNDSDKGFDSQYVFMEKHNALAI